MRELRTATDWAEETQYLVDEMYADVKEIILVIDNLNPRPFQILCKLKN